MVVTNMPLTGHRSEVARRVEGFGQRHALIVESPAIARLLPVLDHVPDAGLVRVQARQQGGARRTTPRGVIELREPQSTRRECIQMRCRNLRAITTEVRKPHVIDQDDHDVRRHRRITVYETRTNDCHKHRPQRTHPLHPQLLGLVGSLPTHSFQRYVHQKRSRSGWQGWP